MKIFFSGHFPSKIIECLGQILVFGSQQCRQHRGIRCIYIDAPGPIICGSCPGNHPVDRHILDHSRPVLAAIIEVRGDAFDQQKLVQIGERTVSAGVRRVLPFIVACFGTA